MQKKGQITSYEPTRPGGENREEGKTEFICVIAKDGDTCRKFVLHVILESL